MLHRQRVKQLLVRLPLATAAVLGSVHAFRLLVLPGIQSVFQPGDAVTSLVRRVGILLSAVLAYWAYARLVEKRSVRELRPAPLAIVAGGVSGAVLILSSMLLLFAIGAYEVVAYRGVQPGLAGVAGLIFIAAMLEEVVFRGILFRLLENACGTIAALWLQSIVFALLHIGNVEGRADTQELVTTVLSGVLLGALWTAVFVCSRNLWVTAANHAAWNFTIILAGLPLSGLDDWRSQAPFASEYRGPAWLTGGVFGPEDSVLTIVLVAAGVAATLYWAKAKNCTVRIGGEHMPAATSTSRP